MWSRTELKEKGKIRFKANYWKCVVASLLLSFTIGGSAVGSGYRSQSSIASQFSMIDDQDLFLKLIAILVGVLAIVFLISFVIDIFVTNPLEVGCQRFFVVNTKENAEFNELSFGFKHSYGNVVKTLLLRDVYLILWSFLFVIPGLIKMYSYRMVPFILAETPDLPGEDAITLSRKMMDGNKAKAFILDLSFFGWLVLSALTCGILQIFYVGPYMAATNAELYNALKGSSAK